MTEYKDPAPQDEEDYKKEMEQDKKLEVIQEQIEPPKLKSYNITYKYSDVTGVVEAESQEQAQEIAAYRLESDYKLDDSTCYEIEVEEVEDE